eukprot:TRINITY_DN4761_c0_g1_i2.p2 TRINITY_DN4761_c0_g1~~TRINITY_DN4761_c0_g1_i2.p2  ORF type:complete len:364 (+),score=118.11 TRINITY_DN4761_c0_g1_i2:91-1182(+)
MYAHDERGACSPAPVRTCSGCGSFRFEGHLQPCPCRKAMYCDERCQQGHWKQHMLECTVAQERVRALQARKAAELDQEGHQQRVQEPNQQQFQERNQQQFQERNLQQFQERNPQQLQDFRQLQQLQQHVSPPGEGMMPPAAAPLTHAEFSAALPPALCNLFEMASRMPHDILSRFVVDLVREFPCLEMRVAQKFAAVHSFLSQGGGGGAGAGHPEQINALGQYQPSFVNSIAGPVPAAPRFPAAGQQCMQQQAANCARPLAAPGAGAPPHMRRRPPASAADAKKHPSAGVPQQGRTQMCAVHRVQRCVRHVEWSAAGQCWQCREGYHCLEIGGAEAPAAGGGATESRGHGHGDQGRGVQQEMA